MKMRTYIQHIIILLTIVLGLLCFDTLRISTSSADTQIDQIDQNVYPHDEVIEVKLTVDEEDYAEMMANAINEEYITADLSYNGFEFTDIGIRPKGNSSLKQVANSSADNKRISFKLNLDHYVDDQSLYGITKINLNNIFNDPSMMAEFINYEMLDELDAAAPRTTYVALYVNDEFHGLYLAVEQVDEAFLEDRFDNGTGELYKPEMSSGSDLKYISDNPDDYELEPESGTSNDKEIIELMKTLAEKGDLDEILNVDSFLKYLAVSTITVHLDAYQGGMFHNYYLYNNNDIFEWIGWDFNMTFNGFPMGASSDQEAVTLLIDEPVSGAMSNYPLIEAVFAYEEYVNRYHDYMSILLDGYLQDANFTNRVTEVYNMIKTYVKNDPTAFYTYETFEAALFQDEETNYSLLTFVKERAENINAQLDGTLPSTNNGEGNPFGKLHKGNRVKPDGVDQQNPAQKQQNGNQKINKPPKGGDGPGATGGVGADAPPQFNIENLQALLPEGVTIQDIEAALPEGMTVKHVMRMIPPDMDLDQLKETIPDGTNADEFITMLTDQFANMEGPTPGGPNNTNTTNRGGAKGDSKGAAQQTEPIDPFTLYVNFGLICLGVTGMIIFTRIIKRSK